MFRFSQSKHPNFLKVYHGATSLLDDVPMIRRKRLYRRYIKTLKWFSIGAIILVVGLALSFGAQFFLIKSAFSQAQSGKNNLEQSVNLMKMEKFDDSIAFARKSGADFRASSADLTKIRDNFLVKRSSFLKGQFDSFGYLLSSAEVLSRTMEKASLFASDLEGLLGEKKKLSFSKFSQEEKTRLLKRIYTSAPELASVKEDLDMALSDLDKVNFRGVLFPFKDKIIELKEKIAYGDRILADAIPVSRIIPRLAGYPSKSSYLLLLQNDDELRPTGGFIGTYGILEAEAGDITRMDTHDIYHMDMPVAKKIDVLPPEPIKKYLNKKWYMRDANWSPDWPTSAEKVLWFYNLENKLLTGKDQINDFSGEFTGVIAITPELIKDLLDITGPISVGGQDYDSGNFTELLQYRVEKGYVKLGESSWQRKEVIGDIVKELKIKLFDLPSSRWNEILDVLKVRTLAKDILVYSKDRELEGLIKDYGWGGEIRKADGDYLMVVDANMAALKTDAVMKRNINYFLKEEDGKLKAKLILNYSHNGKVDWKTSKYQTYTRVYVPYGSKLVSSDGGKSEVYVGNEANKTSFGVYLTVEPGRSASFVIEYELPDRLTNVSNYELLVQKQPGKIVEDMLIDLQLGSGVKSYSPTGFYADKRESGEIVWETDLNVDKVFTVKY